MEEFILKEKKQKDWSIFLSSVFFVFGFTLVFSFLGIFLQTFLLHISFEVMFWLRKISGVAIIFFGLLLFQIFSPGFLSRDHKIRIHKRFRSSLVNSFVFGSVFALGWTPCLSAALGAILFLSLSSPGSAFLLLLFYTLGLGVPFVLVGFFVDQTQNLILKLGRFLNYFQYFFGSVLVFIGILVFTGNLVLIENLPIFSDIFYAFPKVFSFGGNISSLGIFNLFIAFLAGLGSFFSPCIFPIIPGFLSYLASTALTNSKQK